MPICLAEWGSSTNLSRRLFRWTPSSVKLRRFAACVSGMASGPALAVRPARVDSGSARKGESRRCFLRSRFRGAGRKDLRVALAGGGANTDNARRSGLVTVTFHLPIGVLVASVTAWSFSRGAALGAVMAGTGCGRWRGSPARGSCRGRRARVRRTRRSCRSATARPRQPRPPPFAHPGPLCSPPVARLCSRRRTWHQAWRAEGAPLKVLGKESCHKPGSGPARPSVP